MDKYKISRVFNNTLPVYLNLAQAYEAEFSPLTNKKPNTQGIFELDTELSESVHGYIFWQNDIPIGIAAVSCDRDNHYEICEFYIVPLFRKNKLGTQFVHRLWSTFGGSWVIKQIAGAEYATLFWQQAINDFGIDFVEDHYLDPYWGNVTRQQFHLKKGKS